MRVGQVGQVVDRAPVALIGPAVVRSISIHPGAGHDHLRIGDGCDLALVVEAALDLAVALGRAGSVQVGGNRLVEITWPDAPARIEYHERTLVVLLAQETDLPVLELGERIEMPA